MTISIFDGRKETDSLRFERGPGPGVWTVYEVTPYGSNERRWVRIGDLLAPASETLPRLLAAWARVSG